MSDRGYTGNQPTEVPLDASQLSAALQAMLMPTGVVLPYGGGTAPTGWLLCYGQAISRTTYATLYGIIGTTYGSGDGSTTFNVPDLRGRVIAGQDDMGGTSANRLTGVTGSVDGDVLGGTGGAETHTLTSAEMPVHNHGVNDPAHAHTLNEITLKGSTGGSSVPNGAWFDVGTVGINSAYTGVTIQNAGSGNAHNNVQPTIILNYIIKT